jgi:nicotinamide-nucleotide amidase
MPEMKKLLSDIAFGYHDIETIGISESKLAFLLSDLEKGLKENQSIAYLPSLGRVLIRLYTRGKLNVLEVRKIKQKIINLIGNSVIGNGEEEIEKWLITTLSKQGKMIALAESCTGGKVASKITSVSGSSKIFKGSIVAYNDLIKSDLLDVKQLSIQKFGSVSQQVVKEMLIGVLKKFNVDYGIAISGIAGPGGGSDEKPVGTVWVGVGDKQRQNVTLSRFNGNRDQIIELSSISALNQLRKFILEIN